MIKNVLQGIGLNIKEIDIFICLMELGTQPASIIAKKLDMPRNSARFILDQLFDKKMVSKSYRGNVQIYSPIPPKSILNLLEMQKNKFNEKIDHKISNVKNILPELESMQKKEIMLPKVRFFEGFDGINQVIHDTLSATETVYTYVDIDGMVKYIDSINQKYVQKRAQLGIKKKAIIPDTPFAHNYVKDYYPSVSDIRFIDHKLYPFALEMEIYDNKISYMTFSDNGVMAVIIENPEIYQMNRAIFKAIWDNAEPLN